MTIPVPETSAETRIQHIHGFILYPCTYTFKQAVAIVLFKLISNSKPIDSLVNKVNKNFLNQRGERKMYNLS